MSNVLQLAKNLRDDLEAEIADLELFVAQGVELMHGPAADDAPRPRLVLVWDNADAPSDQPGGYADAVSAENT